MVEGGVDKSSDDEVTLSTSIETSFFHGGGVSSSLRNITWGDFKDYLNITRIL